MFFEFLTQRIDVFFLLTMCALACEIIINKKIFKLEGKKLIVETIGWTTFVVILTTYSIYNSDISEEQKAYLRIYNKDLSNNQEYQEYVSFIKNTEKIEEIKIRGHYYLLKKKYEKIKNLDGNN